MTNVVIQCNASPLANDLFTIKCLHLKEIPNTNSRICRHIRAAGHLSPVTFLSANIWNWKAAESFGDGICFLSAWLLDTGGGDDYFKQILLVLWRNPGVRIAPWIYANHIVVTMELHECLNMFISLFLTKYICIKSRRFIQGINPFENKEVRHTYITGTFYRHDSIYRS